MKRTIITMLVVILALATIQARPSHNSEHKKAVTEQTTEQKSETKADEQATDETVKPDENEGKDKIRLSKKGIIVKKDGKDIEIGFDNLNRIINDNLDDTIVNADGITIKTDDEHGIEVGSAEYNLAQDGMKLARDITRYFAVSIVFIVLLSLLFYYLHRRRKYQTVDRAIEAGYPLPNEFYGKLSHQMPQQPTNVYVTQVTPPAADPNAPQGTQQAQNAMPPLRNSSNPLNNITDWTPFKSGLKTTAWGLGLLFFFWILGVTPVAALMVIVVFIGLGKLFIAYQEQQNLNNYWQQQQWAQQAQQPQGQQPQQPQAEGQEIPPMPETPPEFDPYNE